MLLQPASSPHHTINPDDAPPPPKQQHQLCIHILYATVGGQTYEVVRRLEYYLRRNFPHSTAIHVSPCSSKRSIEEAHHHRQCCCRSFASGDDSNVRKLVVIAVATHGEGTPAPMASVFWKFMTDDLMSRGEDDNNRISKDKLLYCVIGLGNSNYEKYNYAAKIAFRIYEKFDFEKFLPSVFLFDEVDPNGIDNRCDEMLKMFGDQLKKLGIPKLSDSEDSLEFCLSEDRQYLGPENMHGLSDSISSIGEGFWNSEVLCIDNALKTDGDRDKLLNCKAAFFIHLKNTNNQLYRPGQILWVRHKNIQSAIERSKCILKNIKFSENIIYKSPIDGEQITIDVEEYLHCFLDMNYRPSQVFFEILSQISNDYDEQMKIKEFSLNTEDNDRFFYCTMPRKNVLDVFEDFPKTSASLTFRHLCLLIPPIRPRPYSICSSYESDRERISLLITEVEYETNLRRRKIYGSCSTYLRSLLAGAEILVKIDTTTFDFKQISANHNLLLVACGSAISPFLAYLSHLEHLLTCGLNSHASDVEKPIEYDIPGSIKMYFGCRYLIEDNFILNTFEMLQSRGILEVFLCPSREAEMIYVQNKIKQHSTSLQSFLCGKQSHIFIAGASANGMPSAVKSNLQALCDGYDANFLRNLEKSGRLQIESWS